VISQRKRASVPWPLRCCIKPEVAMIIVNEWPYGCMYTNWSWYCIYLRTTRHWQLCASVWNMMIMVLRLQIAKQSRHVQYLTHFPIPQEEQFTHECHQRAVTLFGVGKGRESSKQRARKVSKELKQLFHKRCLIDISIAEIGMSHRYQHSRNRYVSSISA